MSLLESKGPWDFDWSNGLSLLFVGSIPHVQADVVLFELGEGLLGPKVGIQLDAQAGLAFAITDRSQQMVSVSIPYGPILSAPFFLLCGFGPVTHTECGVFLSVNGRERAQRTVKLDLPTQGKVFHTMGGDLAGERNASFKMVEMGIFRGPLSENDRKRMLDDSVERYALKFEHG